MVMMQCGPNFVVSNVVLIFRLPSVAWLHFGLGTGILGIFQVYWLYFGPKSTALHETIG
jgi:hypothetical protein